MLSRTEWADSWDRFRWAFGQLEELKHLKSTKLKYITAKLNSLPATLYKTYERMLDEIDPVYKDEALRVLKWLAFSRMPLTLQEVEEVCITDPQSMPYVDEENRGSPGDIVEIISSLVAVETKGYAFCALFAYCDIILQLFLRVTGKESKAAQVRECSKAPISYGLHTFRSSSISHRTPYVTAGCPGPHSADKIATTILLKAV